MPWRAIGMLTVVLLGSGALAAWAQRNPERQAYFGQTHVHTSWSFDAYIFGNTLTGPEDAYKYALGQPIKHPAGYEVQLKRPLDFQAVTDHSEYVGTIRLANDPSSAISKLPVAEKLKVRSKEDIQRVYLFLATSLVNEPIKELLSPEVTGSVWKEIVAIADKYYQPGKFTTFVAYEWSSTPDNRNLHRNVIFKDSRKVPGLPFSAIDSTHPEDLWRWMDVQRQAGNELLAISHNANLSDGIMFPLEVDNRGRPIDTSWAQQRVNNEPLSEIQQLKGASETHPLLSPNDEFAGYEILTYLLGEVDRAPQIHGSYIREAYQNGLAMQETRGYNPYKFGVVGASDSHNTAVPYTESNFFGAHGLTDATPQMRLSGKKTAGLDPALLATSGLGGVWAEENTREAIFAAIGEGPGGRQPRPHPDHQGLDQARPDLRESVRCRLVRRAQARSGERPALPRRQHGGYPAGDVHEHDRRGGTEDRVDGSGVRCEPARLLLCPGAADSDAALDDHSSQGAGHGAAEQCACDRAGARLVFADLVHADGGGTQKCPARRDSRRTQAAGRSGA
jgi:hypothetical protein